ncbi:MAG TPA: glycerophosphodiester phosphodiesterase [Mycobacteriales bacterium]|jgi:glycerophosphoryl diester phosphodiesterase|nr:glycerophosphodiester phosphodiesterase [Mycobacteriales bacterium]
MMVLGHRGWPDPVLHPENTLAAMTAALDGGADGVEVDVRLTADGVAVCCHDDDLQRVGAAVPSVRRATWAQLREVVLPGGHPIPRLLDVAAATAGRGQLVLDLKPEPRIGAMLRASLASLALAGLDTRDVVASSFDERLLEVLAVRRPRLERAAILDVGDPLHPALMRSRRRGDTALHLPLRTVLAEPSAVQGAGLAVRVWTVNRLVDAQLCDLVGVEAVITDRPADLTAGLLRTRAAA